MSLIDDINLDDLPQLGRGLALRVNNGAADLVVTEPLERDEIITWFDGRPLDWHRLPPTCRGLDHVDQTVQPAIFDLVPRRWAIADLDAVGRPMLDTNNLRGVAAWASISVDPTAPGVNAELVLLHGVDNQRRLDRIDVDAFDPTDSLVVVRALRPIGAGDAVVVHRPLPVPLDTRAGLGCIRAALDAPGCGGMDYMMRCTRQMSRAFFDSLQ